MVRALIKGGGIRIKGFLFSHFVLNFLKQESCKEKIIVANTPRLTSMTINDNFQAQYVFEISVATPIKLMEWKHFAFKIPRRKNYKDLDRQVATFMKNESTLYKKRDRTSIEENDWVCFTAQLIDANNQPLLEAYESTLWTKVSTDIIAHPFSVAFLGKKVGESFVSDRLELEKTFGNGQYSRYTFLITINSIVKGSHLSIEAIKANFKLKSKADVHKKLIEVFSYRNDLSQRKAIIEELFHLFFSKHRFEVPKHIVLRKQEDIILSLMRQPDYHVYKSDKNFAYQVETLAERQLKEEIIIDQIAYDENIVIDEKETHYYLNLFNHSRLREFVHFKPLHEEMENPENPINPSILHQAALREKTLNYVIHVLTK